MKKKIIIISGDPNSINSEIIFKCWKKLSKKLKSQIYLISNYSLMKNQLKKLNYNLKMEKVNNIDEGSENTLKVFNLNLKFKNPFKVQKKYASKFLLNSLDLAHKLALNESVIGVINCPLSKKLLNSNHIGVTEYLASKCRVTDNSEVMLIKSKKLSVCPITTHVNIKEVSNKLNSSIIQKKIKTINTWYKKRYKKKANIGILGLNPHNAEYKKNSEELKIITPAIKKLKKTKIKVTGPLVADTLFIKDYKNYDVIVGMYHDQVLTPLKTLYKYNAINITLGLKYLRVSPDHGPAINLINKKIANPDSLLNCIKFVVNSNK